MFSLYWRWSDFDSCHVESVRHGGGGCNFQNQQQPQSERVHYHEFLIFISLYLAWNEVFCFLSVTVSALDQFTFFCTPTLTLPPCILLVYY